MRRSTTIVLTTSVLLVVLAGGAYVTLRRLFPVETLTEIRKTSPDRKHVAELVTREAGFAVNAVVRVDGAVVYSSPDFAAPATADFQERLVWDRSGAVVVLEIGGKRFFGFHTGEGRRLSESELGRVQFSSFDELRFTDDAPGTTSDHP